jgi:hypothetical protein
MDKMNGTAKLLGSLTGKSPFQLDPDVSTNIFSEKSNSKVL